MKGQKAGSFSKIEVMRENVRGTNCDIYTLAQPGGNSETSPAG